MNVGSLFSGIGGFDLGLERAGMRTLWFCESDSFCQRVLAHHWPGIPCHPDVSELRGNDVEPVDVLCGGFPCQDLSWAGAGAGLGGARSGLWSEYARLVGELRPRYVVVENVSALLARGLGVVVGDLAALGYDAEWDCIPASAAGAPHQRDRAWIVAYPQGRIGSNEPRIAAARGSLVGAGASAGGGDQRGDSAARVRLVGSGAGRGAELAEDPDADGAGWGVVAQHDSGPLVVGGRASGGHADGLRDEMADADSERRDGRPGQLRAGGRRELEDGGGASAPAGTGAADWWAVEPDVGRVAHGVPARVDRLRSLGNALVPQIAEWLGRRIIDYEKGRLAA